MLHTFVVACGVLILAVLCPVTGLAQTPHPEAGLTLDFLVTGPDGATPRSLTPAEVVLRVGGREHAIRSLELVSPPDATARAVTVAGDVPAGTPRNIVLVVDEATLYGLEPILKDAVGRLLASLSPRDMVAFISTRGRGRQTNLTQRHETVASFAESLITGPGVLWACQRELMDFLRPLAASVPPGRSTSIVVISRGSPRGASFGGDSESGPCTPRRNELRELEEVIATAQINLHLLTVDAETRSWGFDTIARNVQASTALLTWADAGALQRAIASAAHYYRATFVPDGRGSNRPQRVDLRVNLPGHKVVTAPMIRVR
jgi:hypothetical protein